MRFVFDIFAMLAIFLALVLLWGFDYQNSYTEQLGWVISLCGTYLFSRLIMWFYGTGPKWNDEPKSSEVPPSKFHR